MGAVPPDSTLFPYTTLFRSDCAVTHRPALLEPDVDPIERWKTLVVVRGEGHVAVELRVRLTAEKQEPAPRAPAAPEVERQEDRKSTRLNSSHSQSSYAVFCL